jgi:TRAP-type uncharacterized transport system fused permease subunit
MKDHGYSTEFSVGVTAASATLGPIIPPSLPFVIYGMMANVSIGALFLGGFIPGAVMTIFMMLYVTYCARRYGMGRDQAFNLRVLGVTFIAALPPLLTPVIILGGMTFGWFTPTEAAIAAVHVGDHSRHLPVSLAEPEAVLQSDDGHHRDDGRRAADRRGGVAVRLGADHHAADGIRGGSPAVVHQTTATSFCCSINVLLLVSRLLSSSRSAFDLRSWCRF